MTDDMSGRDQPAAIGTGAELVLVAPAVALAKHVYDAWKDGRPALDPSDPLTFGVASTVTDNSGHTLTLDCSNLGAHGVYLESIAVADPKGIEAIAQVVPATNSINEPRFHSLGHGGDDKVLCLPVLLPSAGRAVLRVRLSLLPSDRMHKKPYGHLSVAYTVSGVAGSNLKKQVAFSIRPSADPELGAGRT